MIIVFLAIGGGLGAGVRYAFSRFNRGFPFGTLLANLLASFSIGICIPSIQGGRDWHFLLSGFAAH
ncbi:CrcB family protein [Chryseomicrobium aureum]|uniref:CrcB family protein n=1 Tax=Chryseomicrobium aureum TaxID=1441723 RepID=UPI00370CFF8F